MKGGRSNGELTREALCIVFFGKKGGGGASVVKDNYLRSASFTVEVGPKSEKCVNLCSYYISMGAEVHTLLTFWTHL